MKNSVSLDVPLSLPGPHLELLSAWTMAVTALLRLQTEWACAVTNDLQRTQREAFDQWVCRWGGGVPIDA